MALRLTTFDDQDRRIERQFEPRRNETGFFLPDQMEARSKLLAALTAIGNRRPIPSFRPEGNRATQKDIAKSDQSGLEARIEKLVNDMRTVLAEESFLPAADAYRIPRLSVRHGENPAFAQRFLDQLLSRAERLLYAEHVGQVRQKPNPDSIIINPMGFEPGRWEPLGQTDPEGMKKLFEAGLPVFYAKVPQVLSRTVSGTIGEPDLSRDEEGYDLEDWRQGGEIYFLRRLPPKHLFYTDGMFGAGSATKRGTSLPSYVLDRSSGEPKFASSGFVEMNRRVDILFNPTVIAV